MTDADPDAQISGFIDEEPPAKFSDYSPEDYLTLVVFWLLAVTVFAQFFTRYVLNDSLAWTEEIARYLLILVGFLGASMAVRRNSHIQVEFFYRYLPAWLGRITAALVDILRVGFFATTAWICYNLAGRTSQMMVSLDIPKSTIYYIVCAALVLMTLRSAWVLIQHLRHGSNLQQPAHSRVMD